MYDYQKQRAEIFTEHGQIMFIKIRDQVQHCIATSGAVRMQEATKGVCGSSWDMLACVDRLVELGELREITTKDAVAGQHRVFVAR